MADPLSVRAFAAKLGVSHVAVLKAIERGRLQRSVGTNGRGHAVILDEALARQEWQANAGRPTKATTASPVTPVTVPVTTVTTATPPPSGSGGEGLEEPIEADSLAEAQRLAALELARQRRLANQMRMGELVPKAAVQKLRFEAMRTLRENLLNLPARLSGSLAAETDAGVIYLQLDAAIREALQATAARYRQEAAADAASDAPAVAHA